MSSGLYLVATPIGNLRDITLRALDVLRGADLLACEDTRVTAKLLRAHAIDRPLLSYREHNAERMRPRLLDALAEGKAVALMSDAGTPLISDPGYKLVREASAAGHAVTALPGPSALLAALCVAALPTDRFLFAGFPPPRRTARKRFLEELVPLRATLVFYETGPRLAESLRDMAEVLGGERPAAVARELTKLHEETRRAGLDLLAGHYEAAGPPRGEIVVLVGPPAPEAPPDEAALDEALRQALAQASLRDAVEQVAAASGVARRTVYARALALQEPRE